MDAMLSSGRNRGMPIQCRAAVSRKPGEPLVIEEIMVAPPMPYEVRIQIVYTSLCQSDITLWKMKDFPGVFPRILGHEAIGWQREQDCVELLGLLGWMLTKDKFEIGKKFGVTDFINPAKCENKSVTEVLIEMTEGGADYCFECVGRASLVQQAYACCRKGWGKTIVLGVDQPGSQLTLPSHDVLHHGKTLMGSLFGGLKPKSDIPVLLNRYINKELQLDEFVTHEVTFEDINKAFDLLIEGKSLRCVICMKDQ